uniref:Uncharacterized protein n=1 Tax=Aegilops tauschii subsp. strangulata TaxID=200361 RepID=A0A453KRT7_AEGTS
PIMASLTWRGPAAVRDIDPRALMGEAAVSDQLSGAHSLRPGAVVSAVRHGLQLLVCLICLCAYLLIQSLVMRLECLFLVGDRRSSSDGFSLMIWIVVVGRSL